MPAPVTPRHAIGLLLLAACGCSPMATTEESDSSSHLFVWAWDVDKDAEDFLAVVDVDRRSATYGQVVRTLPAPGGRGAHHVEYEMSTSQLFANLRARRPGGLGAQTLIPSAVPDEWRFPSGESRDHAGT